MDSSDFGKMNKETFESPPVGLQKYLGEWNNELSAHLLRRTTFGPTLDEIRKGQELGLDGTIDLLFKSIATPLPPVNSYFNNDPDVPIGETWVDKVYSNAQGVNFSRKRSLFAWSMAQMLDGGMNITEKMTLFWHNHFVISQINDPRYSYKYITLLRNNSLGNFKQLTKDITIDPAMLIYLNGTQNSSRAPNENFARELLELFTIGKG